MSITVNIYIITGEKGSERNFAEEMCLQLCGQQDKIILIN